MLRVLHTGSTGRQGSYSSAGEMAIEDGVLVDEVRIVSCAVGVRRKLGLSHSRAFLRLELVLLVVVMVLPLWVMPLSAPVISDVVVVMHHDGAVNTAVRTITENVPDVRVVEYGSLEYVLTVHRVFGKVVWVSHGSEAGILAGPLVLSWRAFSSRTELTPGEDIVLACGSIEITRYAERGSVLGFGTVDAVLGALVTSYLLFSSAREPVTVVNILSQFRRRLIDLFSDPDAPIFLHYVGGGSPPAPPSTTYDFYYKGIYWDAYSIDPDHEVFYDHPDYTYYYTTMGVGPAVDFTIDRTTRDSSGIATGGMQVNHVSRGTVEFWKNGGIVSLAGLVVALGVEAAAVTAGISVPVAGLIAAVLALAGFTVAVVISPVLPDETDSGWVFYEILERNHMRMKIGCGWWIHMISDGSSGIAWPEPCDGHYIRS